MNSSSVQYTCQKIEHIREQNQHNLQLYYVNPSIWQKNKFVCVICEDCINQLDEVCCKIELVNYQSNQIFQKYHWNQILLNIQFNTNISERISEYICKEDFQFDRSLEVTEKHASQLLYYTNYLTHMAQNHRNMMKDLKFFSKCFELLREKVSKCFFDIFDEPKIKIEFQEDYDNLILIQERNIIIGYNGDKINAIIYNYKNQRQIQFNVMKAKLCYNNDFFIFQFEQHLNIIDLNNLQQKILMEVKFQIYEMKIVKDKFWMQLNNQDGIFISDLSFDQLDLNNFKRIMNNKISLFYSNVVVENYYFYYPCNYQRQIVDIKNNKVIFRFRHRICYLKQYDQEKKILIFQVERAPGYKIFIFNFSCKRIIRSFRSPTYWCQVYHNRYLAYYQEDMIIFYDIFNAKQQFRLKEVQSRISKSNYCHLKLNNLNCFWHKN